MKVLSLFSGVGGFDLGLERAGMETVFQCEWDKHATKILERHWPDVPRWDDVSTLTGKHILAHAPVIDVVAWGSPCQDLSVAGKRAGLEGSRSGLFHEGIRIIKELRKETNNVYPRISLWENVYGALNSNKGADFGVILDEMAEAGALVQEWRVLDAQYFGVPQRRRRVFLVSVFDTATAARCPDPLLPVSESVRRDTPTSGTPGQEPARAATQGTRSSRAIIGSDIVGSLNASDWKFPQQQQVHENKCVVETFTKAKRAQTTTDNETWVEGKPAPTLNSFDQGDTRATTVVVGDSIVFDDDRRVGPRIFEQTIGTLQAFMGTGGNNTPMVAQAIPESMLSFDTKFGSNANVFENQAPTLKASQAAPSVAIPIQDGRDIEKHQNGIGIGEEGAPSYTLDQTGAQAVAFATNQRSEVRELDDRAVALSAEPGTNQQTYVAFGLQGNMIGRQDHNGPAGKGHTEEGDPMFTLTGTDIHAVAHTTAFQPGTMTRLGGGVWEELAPTLRAEAKRGDNEPHIAIQYDGYNQKINDTDIAQTLRLGRDSSDFVAQPIAFDGFNQTVNDVSQTIRADKSDGDHVGMIQENPTMAVRRLTPVECERLMGWPDGWTEGQADTHRYKQCGNGVASPVATWIAQQLLQLDKEPDAPPTTTTT
jgi:DNA (cytosine-5)-methyltransferase 1